MSDNTLTMHGDGSATLSTSRLSACLDSIYELEALAAILPGLVPNTAESGRAHYAVRGIAVRIRRLSQLVMSGLSDDLESVENLHVTILGSTG